MKTFKDFLLTESINWAVKNNKPDPDKLENSRLADSDYYALVFLNLEKVMRNVDANPETGMGLDITKPDGGKNAKSFRLSRVRSHISSKGYLDPPIISYNDYTNFIDFENGRHRTFVAYQMGEKIIPFFVPKRQKSYFENNYK